METCCEYTDGTMWVSSDQQKIVWRVRKLKKLYPDQVRIIKQPEENDGCIYATVPAEWLAIAPPRRVNMTDEQKRVAAERLAAIREKQAQEAVDQK